MNTLPLWAQLTIAILGLLNITSVITTFLTNRQRRQELKDVKLQRLNDNLLQNTRPHIDPLYIPIAKILSKLESQYDEYKSTKGRCHGYEVKKKDELSISISESQASSELGLLLYGNKHEATLALMNIFQALIDYEEKMIVEGTSAYFTADFYKRLDSFTRFLRGTMIVTHTYLLSSRDAIGEQPSVYILGTAEFEKELYTEIDYIRLYISSLALGTKDTIEAPVKKVINKSIAVKKR